MLAADIHYQMASHLTATGVHLAHSATSSTPWLCLHHATMLCLQAPLTLSFQMDAAALCQASRLAMSHPGARQHRVAASSYSHDIETISKPLWIQLA